MNEPKDGCLLKKKLTFQEALEEAVAAEAAAANTKAVRLARATTHQKQKVVPVHLKEIEDPGSSEDEEVERLGARPKNSLRTEVCASCGGPHAWQQ